jgi:RHS repeat-associated protein
MYDRKDFLSRNQSFVYDKLDRLTKATQAGSGGYGVLDYTYDLNGNRLTRKQTIGATVTDNETYAYAAGTNRLASVNDNGVNRAMSYIASGSIASDSRGAGTTDDLSFGYNAAGRIITVSRGGAVINRYVYNHMGERVEKRTASNALVERYHYGLEGELLAITGSTGNVIAQYVYLDGLLLAEVNGTGGISFIHSDHLGTPQKISNAAGSVINDYRWQPFGEAMPANSNHRVKFPGQHFDAETSLHYNYFRTYDPTLGRYLEHDPIGLEGGWNRYGYVEGNPLANIDPYGLAEQGLSVGIGGFGGAGFGKHYKFGGLGATIGVNNNGQLQVQVSVTESGGAGAFGGAGFQIGYNYNEQDSCPGVSYSESHQIDVNAGVGPISSGVTGQAGKGSLGGSTGLRGGFGAGMSATFGKTRSTTLTIQLPFTSSPKKCGCSQ